MSGTKVRFGVMLGPGKAEVREGMLPEIGPEELLIKMEACNICTEDYQRWVGLRTFKAPMADGHEYIGRIIDKGEKVIDYYKIGDRVGKLNQQCGACRDCLTGNTGDCQFAIHKAIGLEEYGGMKGFATYRIIPQRLAVIVSEDVPAACAAFLEPLATVIHGVKRLGVRPMENVVVVGAGTMGLLNAQVLRAFGIRVIITENSEKKINRVKSLNFNDIIDINHVDPVDEVFRLTEGVGADAVVFAVGSSIAYKQGYRMLKKYKGRLLFFAAGYPEPEFQFNPNELHYRKIEFIGTINADNADFFDASKMIGNSVIDVSKSLEGKTFSLEDFNKALDAAATPDAYRITVNLSEG
jgi:L-iditol 2-dehydrogenase